MIPTTPRKVTRTAARRAWAERPVQIWWKSAMVIGIVALIVGVHAAWTAFSQRRLLQTGAQVKATITKVKETTRRGYAQPRDASMPVRLEWTMPGGEPVVVNTILPPGPGYAVVGEALALRVDPKNTRVWTEEGEILAWWRVLTIPLIMMLPIAVLLLALALLQRMRVLRVWRDGKLCEAIVVDTKNVSTAPRSRLVRYTLATGPDKRIFTMLFPVRAGVPSEGSMFSVIALPDVPNRALAAQLYVDGTTES